MIACLALRFFSFSVDSHPQNTLSFPSLSASSTPAPFQSGNRLCGKKCGHRLGILLRDSPSLLRLNLSGNPLGDEGVAEIQHVLERAHIMVLGRSPPPVSPR